MLSIYKSTIGFGPTEQEIFTAKRDNYAAFTIESRSDAIALIRQCALTFAPYNFDMAWRFNGSCDLLDLTNVHNDIVRNTLKA